ncbi:MAG: type II secretion system protein [Deltaproteobacteria bacterium]|nr:type II secretion system protein [Deltaproteobacteria bacterium]
MKTRRLKAFTMIELMVTVLILMLLVATAMPSYSRIVNYMKSTEAVLNIGKLFQGAKIYFENQEAATREGKAVSEVFPPTWDGGCHPAEPTADKRMPNSQDWRMSPWTDLQFEISDPHYYCYNYINMNPGQQRNATFIVEARGDLNGDGFQSIFSKTGAISADGTAVSSPGGLYKFRPNE